MAKTLAELRELHKNMNTETKKGAGSSNGFWSPEDYYAFVNIFKYDTEKVVLDKYCIFEKGRDWAIYNWLQYFSLESLTREFEANGLRLCETYGDVTGSAYREEAPEIAVVVQKTR